MALTIKLVYQPTGEIRRIPSGSCPSFSALQADVLPSLFGAPPEKEFTLQYCDDEGDLCTIGSDSELEEAVAVAVSMGAKSLRLRVFPTKDSAIESQKPKPSPSTATASQTAAATTEATGKCVTIRLESHKFAFKEMALDGTIDQVTIDQVHSKIQPTPTNWGWNGNILWVDQGLGATFKVVLHVLPHRDYDTMPAIHYGIVCDRSGQCPIIGPRFKLRGEDYDLCQAEFDKCSDAEKAHYIRIEAPGVAGFANGFPWHFRGLCGGRRGGGGRCGRGGGKNKPCKGVNEIQDAAKNLGEILEHASLDELLMQAQIAESLGSGSGSPVSDSPVVRLISSFTGVPELATAAATIISALNQDAKVTAPPPAPGSTAAARAGSEPLEEKTVELNETPTEGKTSASGLSAPPPVPPLAQLVGAMAGPAIGAMASQVVQMQQAQAQAKAGLAVHKGISCDRSGQCPIIGPRFNLEGADYDLCQEEFDKCSEAEKLMYVCIDRPGMKGIKIMDQGAADEEGDGSTDPELLQALAASLEAAPSPDVKTESPANAPTKGAAAEEDAKEPEPAAAVDPEDFEVVSKPEAPEPPVKFEEELNSLAKMGFFDREANIALLERYNGRLDRVINYLLDI